MKNHSTAKRLRHVLDESELGATAWRLGINELSTQGSRSGNPGLKAATALRFATSYAGINNVKTHRLRSSATNLALSLC